MGRTRTARRAVPTNVILAACAKKDGHNRAKHIVIFLLHPPILQVNLPPVTCFRERNGDETRLRRIHQKGQRNKGSRSIRVRGSLTQRPDLCNIALQSRD